MSRRCAVASVVILLSTFLVGFAWAADWPMLRQNAHRTGWQPTPGEMTAPAVLWSLELGGSYRAGDVLIGDLIGNGMACIATVVGGRVVVRDPEERIIWSSDSLDVARLLALADFDGDGRVDLLAARDTLPSALIILDGRTGALHWLYDGFPPGAGNLPASQVVVTDLDGDGLPDLVASPRDYIGTRAFSFSNGYQTANPPDNLLWEYPQALYGKTVPYVAGDLTNDGGADLVFFENRRLTVLNGSDATEHWVVGDAFLSYSFGLMQIINVDDDPQQELIAVGSDSLYNLVITVADVVKQEIQWQIQWQPPGTKRLVFVDDSVADFTGDGQLEIAVSIYNNIDDEYTVSGSTPGQVDGVNAPNQWTTILYRASDGVVTATIPNTLLRGVADLTGDGVPELLVQRTLPGSSSVPTFGILTAYTAQGASPSSMWSLADATLALRMPPLRPERNTLDRALQTATQDLDGDGVKELYVWVDSDGDNRANALRVYKADREVPILAAPVYPLPSNERVTLVTLGDDFTGPQNPAQTVLAWTDGYLHILDKTLSTLARVRHGSHTTEPLVADLDGDGVAELVVAAANRSLRVYDPSEATASQAPRLLWSYDGLYVPILVTDDLRGDGKRVIPVTDGNDSLSPRVLLLDADGETLWSHTLANYGSAPLDYVFGRFNDDAVRDLLVVVTDLSRAAATDMRLVALSGVNGAQLWNVPTATNTYFRFPLLLHDVNNDGLDDLILADTTRVETYSGADGSLLFALSDTSWSLNHLLADLDKDDDPELVLVNSTANHGVKIFELLSDTATRTLALDYPDEVGDRWIGLSDFAQDELHLMIPRGFGRLTVTGAVSGDLYDRYLRDGAAYATNPGGTNSLRGVTSCDITDDGVPKALFGTADGYLSALDPQTGDVAFSLNMGSPVGVPVAADVTGDGSSDILVTTYDGRLHLVVQAALDAPASVRDVAVTEDFHILDPETDIDTSPNAEALGIAWDAVGEADGYVYSVLDLSGNQIVPWTDAGAQTEAIVTLTLIAGQTYVARVRAYDQQGRTSAETLSDGVLLMDDASPWVEALTATPDVFNPLFGPTRLTARLSDTMALSGRRLRIAAPGGGDLVDLSLPLNTRLHYLDYLWDGMDGEIPLPDGVYTVTVTAMDFDENATDAQIPVEIDTQAPAVPVIDEPLEGDIIGPEAVPVAGTAVAAWVRVFVDDGEEPACLAAVDPSGAWACSLDPSFEDGDHHLTAQAADLAGNRSPLSDPVAFHIDRTPPEVPQIRVPVPDAIIETTFFDVSGGAESQARVSVFLVPGGDLLCEALADAQGDFSCRTDLELENGHHWLSARATDLPGNVGEASAPQRFVMDAPSPPDGDTDGDTPDGDADGDAPDGDLPDGDKPDGDTPDGDDLDGDFPDGDFPDGDLPDGDEADGDVPDGAAPGSDGCGGCQATGGNLSFALLTLALLTPWLIRRRRLG